VHVRRSVQISAATLRGDHFSHSFLLQLTQHRCITRHTALLSEKSNQVFCCLSFTGKFIGQIMCESLLQRAAANFPDQVPQSKFSTETRLSGWWASSEAWGDEQAILPLLWRDLCSTSRNEICVSNIKISLQKFITPPVKYKWDFRFSRRRVWRLPFSGKLHRVVS
jgi:hypothetical protein